LKKIILFLLLITSLYSDTKLYLGASYGYFNEEFTHAVDAQGNGVDAQSTTGAAKFKVGYGVREAYAIEFSLDYIDNKSKIFSDEDGAKYAFNLDFVKAFDLDIYVNPFFKAGFGAGFLDINRVTQKTLNYGSYNLGLGMFIPIDEYFDFEVGYDYKNLSYESINTVAQKLSYESNVNVIYFGFNVRY